MKCPLRMPKLSAAIALLTVLTVVAPPIELLALARNAVRFQAPPRGSGAPSGRVRGGASRGDCPAVQVPLTALVHFTVQTAVKEQKEPSVGVLGLTVSQRPTFWFYMPYENWSAYPAEFLLREGASDEDEGDVVYKTAIALPAKPGVIGIPLPDTVPALKEGKSYRWFFKVYCSQPKHGDPLADRGVPISVEGAIQRIGVTPTMKSQLETASPQQKVELYATNGIWYDALTILAKLRQANPQDKSLEADWVSLLESVELNNVANAPIVK